MNNRQLESFLTIAQLGSFAAAAERLHVTQSTISARIQELEEDLGVELFDRSQRQVHLTLKGRELVGYAEQVSALFSEIKERIGSSQSLTGLVRIGVAELVAITWLPKFARLVREQYPGILVISGMMTSGCVRATVNEATALNYPVIVVADAVVDQFQISHEVELFDMAARYTDVALCDQLVEFVEQGAAQCAA